MKSFFVIAFGFLCVFICLFIYSKYPVTDMFFAQGLIPELEEIQPLEINPYGQWFWVSSTNSAGDQISPKDVEDFILTLTPDGRLTSTTDCNTVSGSYIQNQSSISVGNLISTKKSCKGRIFESSYISQLTLVSSFEVTGNALILYLANNSGEMTFFRK